MKFSDTLIDAARAELVDLAERVEEMVREGRNGSAALTIKVKHVKSVPTVTVEGKAVSKAVEPLFAIASTRNKQLTLDFGADPSDLKGEED